MLLRYIGLQVIDHALDSDKQVQDYETFTSDLLEWIEQTIVILNDRQFANSLYGVQQQLAAFNSYRTKEKPKKYNILFSPWMQFIRNIFFQSFKS